MVLTMTSQVPKVLATITILKVSSNLRACNSKNSAFFLLKLSQGKMSVTTKFFAVQQALLVCAAWQKQTPSYPNCKTINKTTCLFDDKHSICFLFLNINSMCSFFPFTALCRTKLACEHNGQLLIRCYR